MEWRTTETEVTGRWLWVRTPIAVRACGIVYAKGEERRLPHAVTACVVDNHIARFCWADDSIGILTVQPHILARAAKEIAPICNAGGGH